MKGYITLAFRKWGVLFFRQHIRRNCSFDLFTAYEHWILSRSLKALEVILKPGMTQRFITVDF